MAKKKQAFMDDMYVQIDVMNITNDHVQCNLYTGVLCCKMLISRSDYDELVRMKFFIRDGKTIDAANVVNTTEVFNK